MSKINVWNKTQHCNNAKQRDEWTTVLGGNSYVSSLAPKTLLRNRYHNLNNTKFVLDGSERWRQKANYIVGDVCDISKTIESWLRRGK